MAIQQSFDSSAFNYDRPVITYEKWYKNSWMADVTLKYGPGGAHKFTGHRVILGKSSVETEAESSLKLYIPKVC